MHSYVGAELKMVEDDGLFTGLFEGLAIASNADTDGLESVRLGGGLLMGHVDEVNGDGATEIAGFTATKHELLLLAQHWAKEAIDIEYSWFCLGGAGSRDMRQRAFAWRRVSRIAEQLGREAVDKAVKAAELELGKGRDCTAWRVFLNGTDEERRAVQEEIEREMMNVQKDGGLDGTSGQ